MGWARPLAEVSREDDVREGGVCEDGLRASGEGGGNLRPYYEEPGITIYHGDCRDVLPSITADVLVTDPPYGVNLGKHAAAADPRGRHLAKQAYASYDDTPENFSEVVAPAISIAIARCKRAMVFCVPPSMWQLPPPDAIGGIFVPSAVGRNRWGWSNLIHCLMYGVAPGLERGAKHTAISKTVTAEDTGHPTTKPLEWMKWAVALGSEPSDTVVDPFMGSGTTLRAAKDLGRHAIGIEIEERYCEVAVKRLRQETLALGRSV